MERELCSECDGETGKAGRCEDSLYLMHAASGAEVGPLCEECYESLLDDPDETYITEY